VVAHFPQIAIITQLVAVKPIKLDCQFLNKPERDGLDMFNMKITSTRYNSVVQ